MNFCNLALIALVSSTTGVSAFSPTFVSKASTASVSASALSMIYPGSRNNNIVAFTTTIHREEVNLESLSIPQLNQMMHELEVLNELCTEDGTQTNAECDVELKDERDFAVVQIQRILNEKTGKNSNLKYVDMETIREIVAKPWIYPLQKIRQQIEAMDILNCECTEDGNQTDSVCDVQLKDERDAAIETLGLYMKSVEVMLATENIVREEEAERNRSEPATPLICRDARVEAPVFVMGEIRDCVDHPGSKSLVEMQAMLAQLESAHNDCTEEGTQTNPECDVEVKAERDVLMESLVSMIHDARLCMDQIKAFARQGDKLNEVAVEEVMEAVINTIPNLPTVQSNLGLQMNADANINANNPASTYQGPTDEFLVQI